MAKLVANSVLDAALNYIATNGGRLDICSTQPTTYAEATSTYSLGNVTLTTGAGGASYSAIADGTTSGRKITVAAVSGISVTATGSAQHVAISKTTATTELLYVTTLASAQSVTSGNTANVAAWTIEIADPA